MSFIIAAIVMIVVAAACIAVPLWRARAKPTLSTDAANRSIHTARMEELQADVAAGRLSQADYAAALCDLNKELAATLDVSRQEHDKAAKAHGSRRTAGIVAALVVIAAGLLYWQLGNWRAGVQGVQQASVASVEQMVAALATRLYTQDPNDLPGWKMLGHAYLLMGRYAEAEDAYAHAVELAGGKDADVLAGYGEAVALADPKNFMALGMPAIEQALVLDPTNPQALWYGGLGALERGDKTLAITRWQALLTQGPPPEYRVIIEKSIAAAGGAVTPTTPAGAEIQVRVMLAADLRDKVSPAEALFVFAVPAGQSGGPPLVARRFEVRDLPLEVTLSNSDAVLADHNLTGVARATIIARIASKGTPAPQSGDLVGQAQWQADRNRPVNILIDKVLP